MYRWKIGGTRCTKNQLSTWEFFRDPSSIYEEHIVQRTRDKIKVDILDQQVSELVFVESFKPGGYLHTSIMYLQCKLWSEEWDDRIFFISKGSCNYFSCSFFLCMIYISRMNCYICELFFPLL